MTNPMPPRRHLHEVARCLMAFIGLVVAGAAHSDVITVNPDGTADYTSIQAGIEAASDGDEVHVMPGRYTGKSVLLDTVGKAIRVVGVAGPLATIIDGEGRHEFVWIRNGEGRDTVIEGLTFRGGRYSGSGANRVGGCLRMSGASPTIRDCIFEDNIITGTTWWTGAAIYVTGGAPLIERCLFRDNFTEPNEIAYFEDGSSPEIDHCVFTRNAGTQIEVQDGSRLTVRNSAFVGNLDSPIAPRPQIVLWNSPAISEIEECVFLANRQDGDSWTSDSGSIIHMPNAYSGSNLLLSGSRIHDCGEGDPLIGELPWKDGGGNLIAAMCTTPDCDADGVIDAEAIQLGLIPDCDENWIPDSCDIASGDIQACHCPGDLDGDGDVDAADLGLWLTYAGTECEPGVPCPGDLDGDGEIRGSDLGLILLQWGLCD